MPNEVTPGELDRRLRDHEARTDRIHGEQDSRITQVAAQLVPLAVWQQAERARDAEVQRLEHEHVAEAQRLEREHQRDIAALRDEIKDLRGRGWLTTGRVVVIATALIALAALLIQAWGTLKGAK